MNHFIQQQGAVGLVRLGRLSNIATGVKETDAVNVKQLSEAIENMPAAGASFGYNVSEYGAIGDGVTDDRDALNTLLNSTAPTGSTIYFPPGTYLISSNISIVDKQFTFIGVQSIIKTTSNISIFTISSTTTAASKFKIQDLIFKGNDGTTSQIGLNFSDNSGSFLITNCSFTDFGGSGIAVANTETSDQLGGIVSTCKFYSNNIGVNLLNRGEYVQIVTCDFISNIKGILSIAGNSFITGCNINYNTTGIETDSGANNGHNIISDCNINHNSSYSLNIQNTTLYMTISDCHIYQGEIRVFTTTGVEFLGGIIDVDTLTLNTNTDCKFNHVKFDNTYTNTLAITGNAPEFFRCSGDIPTGAVNNGGTWVDYTATSTVVGWASFTTKVIRYTIVGKVGIIEFAIQGTSNATTTSLTMPFTNANFTSKVRTCYAANNGTPLTTGGIAWVNSNSATITIYTDWALNQAWTGSGNKHIVGTIEVELA